MDNKFYFGEIIEVFLNDDSPEYQDYIKCRLLDDDAVVTARPINKQIKYIPLRGEVVMLIYAPSAYYSDNEKHYEFYYLFPINLHENVNHNALFNATTSYHSQYDKHTQSDVLGTDFKEKEINDVQAYEGDTILQGRFGNVIRLSKSNVKNNLNHPSTWVKGSSAYQPIITISNNLKQKDLSKNKNITEDINEDGSSIYITYDQKVNIDLASKLFDSYETKPKTHASFIENQILLNSDRITLNAKTNSVFVNAKKSVSVSSDDSVNIDSKGNTIINSDQTFVGSKDAAEPILFGELTDTWLNELLDILDDVLTSLSLHIHGTGVGPSTAPLPDELLKYTTTFKTDITTIRNKIEQLKSTKNFVD